VGGDGGGGENTNYFDRVGGGSGGGSGGHIVLSSAAAITVYGQADPIKEPGFWYRDNPDATLHAARPISAVGGQGGAGNNSRGGANENGPTTWGCDSIPIPFFGGYTDVGHLNKNCFKALPDNSPEEDFWVFGAGGDGSPGIVQFHVNNPATDLTFPDLPDQANTYVEGQDISYACAPPPLGWKEPGVAPDVMIPFFGRNSMAQSKWIPLGLARINPGASNDQVVLRFQGTDTVSGELPNDGSGSVDHLTAILGPEVIVSPTYTISLDASGLAVGEEIYTENPNLTEGFTVMLEDSIDADNYQHYVIVAASYDSGPDRFVFDLDTSGPSPLEFNAGGNIQAYLVPHYVRVVTNSVLDSYPTDTAVRVWFDATVLDPLTDLPSDGLAHGFTADVDDLNSDTYDFIRFRVEFDLDTDTNGVDLTTFRPALDFLRVHFDWEP